MQQFLFIFPGISFVSLFFYEKELFIFIFKNKNSAATSKNVREVKAKINVWMMHNTKIDRNYWKKNKVKGV